MRSIASDRLLMRPWRADDADFLLDLESRWEIRRFLRPQPRAMSVREDAVASIARRRAIDHPIHGVWALSRATDRRRLGNVLLKPIPLSANELAGGQVDVEIGWHLHPNAWGHGYATESAQAAIDDAFSQGLARVIAVTHPDNEASQAVCRRLSMTPLGRTNRYYDAPHELFELLSG